MSPSLTDHLTLWRTAAADLAAGKPLSEALEHIHQLLAKTELGPVADQLARRVRSGSPLSQALAAHPRTFSRCVLAMVKAGEAGGVLDVVARRIADGLRDGSVPLPDAGEQADDPGRFTRALARLLSCGVPAVEALELLGQELAGPRLADAAASIRQSLLEGSDMASARERFPTLFPQEVRAAVARGERQGDLDEQLDRAADALESGPEAEAPSPEPQSGAAVQFVRRTLRRAMEQGASDIHFEPSADARGQVRLRVDGVLRQGEPPPEGLFEQVVSRIKSMAAMDVAESRVPQDGRMMLDIAGRKLDLRVSVVPTIAGERVVMRVLDREAVVLDLERIGLLDDDLATLRELCHLPNGIVVCNGPTGSGKSTLLYAMLMEMDRRRCCVMTVEDPVRYCLEDLSQVQVMAGRGLTFARALRSILRQDPDVIMVGEIRDLETVQVTVQCSLTGHLMLTSLHANTSPGAIRRLLDMGLEPFLVNATLAGVVSQRLVRVLCPECKEPAEPPLHSIPPAAADFVRSHGRSTFWAPKGCERCRGTGYRGRTAIHEILVPEDRVRRAVSGSADLATLRNAALAAGMRPMLLCGMEKAAQGITSVQEVCRVVPHGPND
ncbi:MAG: ATPase, T2SS/T4P/T4SS family [Candidatus Brocadiia bacterium]